MIKSRKTLLSIIQSESDDIEKLILNIDNYYYEKLELKINDDGTPKLDKFGKEKFRILYPSKGELKAIQHKIKNRILNQIELPKCVFGGVKGRDNILNAKCHKGKKYKFVTDLNSFFPSVKPFQIYKALIREQFSPDCASIITKLVTYKNQLPQGAPTSTHISNIVLKEIDIEILEICKLLNITYSRFVDDLSFSSASDFKQNIANLIQPIIAKGFNISHRKTKYSLGAIEVTGIWARNNDLEVSDKMKLKISNPNLYTENQNLGNQTYTKRVRAM